MQSAITPEDEAFVQAFHSGQIANQQFHHQDHLRLAWVLIQHHGATYAGELITATIRQFAAHHGAPERYNETMTRFWIWAVNAGIQKHPALGFHDLLGAEPHLLDKGLPLKHWSKDVINSDAAKHQWVDADVYPLPV